jgi:uncharacterized protein YuzE
MNDDLKTKLEPRLAAMEAQFAAQSSADSDGFDKEDFADDGAYLARFSTVPTEPQTAPLRRGSMAAQWTYDPEAEAYYFAPMQAAEPPYLTQRHVEAILDIASDGTLAGVELIDRVPPPPTAALSRPRSQAVSAQHRYDQDGQTCPTCGRVGNGEG